MGTTQDRDRSRLMGLWKRVLDTAHWLIHRAGRSSLILCKAPSVTRPDSRSRARLRIARNRALPCAIGLAMRTVEERHWVLDRDTCGGVSVCIFEIG